jgi:hypothetical protein
MSYNDMLSDFTTILDRDDMTVAQGQLFLNQGIARIQRTARLPSMERAQLITPTLDCGERYGGCCERGSGGQQCRCGCCFGR